MGSTGTKGDGVYSHVDTRTTPMSAEDIKQVSGDWSTGYFQTGTSFGINKSLRRVAEEGVSLDKALDDRFGRDVNEIKKTIEAMDRNMHPIDKDMKLVRLVDSNYTDKLFKSLGVSDEIRKAVNNMTLRGSLGAEQDKYLSELKEKLVGAHVQEPSYMSCSHDLQLKGSAFKSRRVALDIEAPKGTMGMFSPTRQEAEFVLARNSGYHITNIRFDQKDHRLVFEVRMGK